MTEPPTIAAYSHVVGYQSTPEGESVPVLCSGPGPATEIDAFGRRVARSPILRDLGFRAADGEPGALEAYRAALQAELDAMSPGAVISEIEFEELT